MSMSEYKQWVSEFRKQVGHLLTSGAIDRLLTYSNRLNRYAVAVCNGDYPADNGERATKECPQCKGLWAPLSFRSGKCPDCYTENQVRRLLSGTSLKPDFAGDPRGAVLSLYPLAATEEEISNGTAQGRIPVPCRNL